MPPIMKLEDYAEDLDKLDLNALIHEDRAKFINDLIYSMQKPHLRSIEAAQLAWEGRKVLRIKFTVRLMLAV